MKPVFDAYGENYDDVMKKSIGFLGLQHGYYTRAKADCLLDQLQKLYGCTRNLRVLDVGCGIGKTDGLLFPNLGKLCGVDVSAASVERARRENPQVDYSVYDGQNLPFQEASFDAAFLICVLHHVAPEARAALLREVCRTLRPGGALFIFEHNPFHPLTRLAVARCEFDREAQLLSRRTAVRLLKAAGLKPVESQYLLYLPFKLKGLRAPIPWCRNIPLGAQFFVSGVKHAE